MELLLSIDAGTTSVKAGLFTPDGNCLAIARQEYQLETPAPGLAELDPEVYWQASVRAIRTVLERSKADSLQVSTLTVSSQGETTIAVNQEGIPLHPAIVWLDNRAAKEARWLDLQLGNHAYQFTGQPDISPTWSACKILWLKWNEPEVYAKTQKFLLVQDWLVYKLTGRFVTDGSISCTTLLYDISRDQWWPEALDAIELSASRLCDISQPGAIAGRLVPEASTALGLGQHTRVVLGGMDQAVGAIGTGNIRPGMISETTGAALALQISIPRTEIDPNQHIPINIHSAPGLYLFEPFCPTAGMAFKWFRDVFGETEMAAAQIKGEDAYDLLTDLAAAVPPGADGLLMLPHLSGAMSPIYNNDARGVFCGFTLAHNKGHFVRAIMEAIAFMLRRNLDQVAHAGSAYREIRSSGGGARSQLWNQIKADVCGIPVISLASEEAALLGDAILGGVANNMFNSLEEGCQRMITLATRTKPGINQAAYEALYKYYCALDDTLDPFFRKWK
jgi:sugar (pentulose or hexulose) kinase